jgi:hypothetical protein
MYGTEYDPGGLVGAAESFGSSGDGCSGVAAAGCGGSPDDAPSTPASLHRLTVDASPELVIAQVRELFSSDRLGALRLA